MKDFGKCMENMDIPRLKPLAVFTGGQQNWDFLLVEHFGQDGAGLDVRQRTEVGLCGLPLRIFAE